MAVNSVNITAIKAPSAGIYPQGLFKKDRGDYFETLSWYPEIRSTFEPNTVYKAVYTLEPVNADYFGNTTIDDIDGIPLNGVADKTASKDENNLIVEVTFMRTGPEKAKFHEFENTLFYDDFNGDSLDFTKWQDPVHYRHDRQGNSKWEPRNVSAGDGVLKLRFAKENEGNNFITASAVRSKGKFEGTYGYYEAKIRYPNRSGAWGAFWLFNESVNTVGNGGIDGTEIDIIELSRVHENGSNSALHWDGYGPAHKGYGKDGIYNTSDYPPGTNLYDGNWHIYALEWMPYEYIVYIDGKVMWRVTENDLAAVDSGICRNPLYIKLSVESSAPTNGTDWNMGWGGPVSPGIWEEAMEIDYVAVYDRPKNK
ncbi:MAG: glycoside hydrolase family 16 protein [Oscillospiraceae bacterium]|nr:glycoside hydrolase family 16 protein [Oscillospiraceae bacterium]